MGVTKVAGAMRRHRSGLTPMYVTTGVVAVGEASQYVPLTPLALALAGGGLACASWVNTHGGDDRNKLYLWGVLGASTSAVLTLHELGWAHFDWTAIIAAGLGTALGIPWWRNNRRTTKVTLERTVERWPSLARKLHMDTVRPVDIRAHGEGNFGGRLVWPAGDFTVSEILDKRDRIEGALDLPAGTLRMERNGRHSNSVLFKAFVTDPHAKGIRWQIPVEEVDGELYVQSVDACDPITLGYREDGELKTMTLTDREEFGSRSVMIAGSKGSGKSGLVNLIAGNRACARNAVMWGVDLKGGMELGPWRNVMDWVVTNFTDAMMLLEALEAVVDARANHCAEMGIRRWPMTEEYPVLTVIVDECHSFNGAMNRKQLEMLERVIQKGRAVGVEIIEATQYPTLLAFGSNLVREQLDQRFCFRMQSDTGEYFVFGNGRDGKVGANMIAQSRPGTCYYQDAETIDRMPIRIQYVDDETVKALVKLRQGRTCSLDAVSAQAAADAVPEYADRAVVVPLDDDGVPAGHVPASRDNRDTVPDGRDMSRDSAGQERDMPGQDDDGDRDTAERLDGPDVPLAELTALRLSGLSPEERDAMSRERAAMVADRERDKLDEDAAVSALIEALKAAGSEGVAARDLRRVATRSTSWLYPKLAELKEAGRVHSTQHGYWAWSESLVSH